MVYLRSHPTLLIVDMQNGFCHPSGTFGKMGLPVDRHMAIVPTIKNLRAIAHLHDIPVIYLRMGYKEDYSDSGITTETWPAGWPALKELKGFIQGTWDTDIVDELKPDASKGEIVIEKTRNTGFWNTELQAKLTQLNSDQLIVTGVGTDVCVESTVRDAFTNDIYALVVSDGTGTFSEEEHQASLKSMRYFGEIATADEIVTTIKSR
jgi:ureidoacrylate peracid hydrolase